MWTGVQATINIPGGQQQRCFTWGWPADLHVLWHLMPVTPTLGNPSLDWDVAVERYSQAHCTYWITVTNLTSQALTYDVRFAVLS